MRGKKTGGRIAGVPNRATASIRAAAAEYSQEALATLVEVMRDAAAGAPARVGAAREILDRAHGKPAQAITGEGGTGPVKTEVHHHYEP